MLQEVPVLLDGIVVVRRQVHVVVDVEGRAAVPERGLEVRRFPYQAQKYRVDCFSPAIRRSSARGRLNHRSNHREQATAGLGPGLNTMRPRITRRTRRSRRETRLKVRPRGRPPRRPRPPGPARSGRSPDRSRSSHQDRDGEQGHGQPHLQVGERHWLAVQDHADPGPSTSSAETPVTGPITPADGRTGPGRPRRRCAGPGRDEGQHDAATIGMPMPGCGQQQDTTCPSLGVRRPGRRSARGPGRSFMTATAPRTPSTRSAPQRRQSSRSFSRTSTRAR